MSAETLLAPGTLVAIGPPDRATEGVVLAVTVRGPRRAVSYDVAWWDGGTRRSDWLQPHEVRPLEGHEPVGFSLPLA